VSWGPAIRCILWVTVLTFALQAYLFPTFEQTFALSYVGSENFSVYQLITYSFLHGDFWHMFFNMFLIVIFGMVLERLWGTKRFLIFYAVTAMGAAMIHTGVNMYEVYQATGTPFPEVNEQKALVNYIWGNTKNGEFLGAFLSKTIGASGVVFGVLVAFAYLFPREKLYFLLVPIPIPAKWLVIAYVGLEAYLAFYASPTDNIAHFAHLGGGLFGFLMARWWKYVDVDRKIAQLR
jgi:membrane associated rhomboid family serine protease